MNNATSIRKHLFSLNNRGIKYDLERIRIAANRCGNPQNAYQTFHVAGTNGKGSTSTFIESVLRKNGYKTGLYTSPHIVNFEERFLVNGIPVGEEEWVDIYLHQQKVIDELSLTFFEAITLMAFELFKRNEVEWAVFETGMGGRLDATNIIDPKVSVITRIAMDHTDYLGPTIVSIAKEKLGIVKNNRPLVIANNNDPELMDIAKCICAEKNSQLSIISESDAQLLQNDDSGITFKWNKQIYHVPLRGSFQLINSLLALNALKCAGFDNYEKTYSGLSSSFIPARFQVLSVSGKTLIFDVGHNPDAATVVVDTLSKRYSGKSICFVTGIMKDKDTQGILKLYRTVANHIILSHPAIERAAQPELLLGHIDDSFRDHCEICKTVADAVKVAFTRDEELICITGSFYTVGEAFEILGISPYSKATQHQVPREFFS